MDRFLVCMPFVLAQEDPHPETWADQRNFSNDKHDPGGKTFNGITQREYDIWRKGAGLQTKDVREMTQDEGYAIYEKNYWLPDCPHLLPGLDLSFFDASVNMGTTEATKILQVALQIPADGLWGPKTDSAVANITRVPDIIDMYMLRRKAVYRQMAGFQYFGTDWLKRATEIGAESIKMAGAS